MSVLKISQRWNGDVTILDLDGNIRIGAGSVEFRQALRQSVINGEKKILLNMANISYIDSSGLGEIVSGYTLLQKNGGVMKLLQPARRVHELMTMTKLLTVFEVFDNEAEAVFSFKASPETIEVDQAAIVTGKLDRAVAEI